MSHVPVRPAARYGDPGPVRRRLRLVVAIALGAVIAAWAVWAGLGLASDRVDATLQGYQVADDSTVYVTFSLAKRADATVQCTVEALSSTSARVGIQTPTYGPGNGVGATSVQTVEVKTQQRAVTGVVSGCRPVG